MTALTDALLMLLVALVWLGCLGFVRLRSPLDRLHCASFVNVAAGLVLVVLGFTADGASVRACKIVLIALVTVVVGAALSHVVARALVYRAEPARADDGTAA